MPFYIALQVGGVFAFAGMWARWEGGGEILESCCTIVMPSSGVMWSLHARMPAIVDPDRYETWLDKPSPASRRSCVCWIPRGLENSSATR
jgi:putative SOS response-associated peptidase YedK